MRHQTSCPLSLGAPPTPPSPPPLPSRNGSWWNLVAHVAPIEDRAPTYFDLHVNARHRKSQEYCCRLWDAKHAAQRFLLTPGTDQIQNPSKVPTPEALGSGSDRCAARCLVIESTNLTSLQVREGEPFRPHPMGQSVLTGKGWRRDWKSFASFLL